MAEVSYTGFTVLCIACLSGPVHRYCNTLLGACRCQVPAQPPYNVKWGAINAEGDKPSPRGGHSAIAVRKTSLRFAS